MDRKLKIIRVENPFNRINRQVSVVPFNGESLAAVRAKCAPREIDFVVSLNGKVIPEHDQTRIALRDGDHITLVPRVAGDNPLAALAMIAIAIAAIYIAGPLGVGALVGSTLGIGTPMGMSLVMMGINLVGGMIVNALLPPPEPKKPGAGDTSPSYSWNPQTVQQQGGPIPRMYGLNKCPGNIISAFLENVNDQQYLNVLIDLGLGPVNRLYNFKINDQPVGNFKGVQVHTRLGNLNQDPIPNFNDTRIEYLFSTKVSSGSPATVTTQQSDFDGLEVELLFPQGLWYADDSGNICTNNVTVRVLAKLQGASTWIVLTESGADKFEYWYGGKWSAGYYVADTGGSEGGGSGSEAQIWYEIADGGTDTYAHHDGEPYAWGYWRWIQNSTEIVAAHIIDNVTITAAKTGAVRRTFRKNGLVRGKYDIKVEKLTPDRNSTRYGDELYLSAVREVFTDDFEYPRRVLVGIRALATSQLSGSLRFSCLCEGARVRVHDGTNWTVPYSTNPAWVCFDALTQPVFDNSFNAVRYDGVDPSRLDLPKFREWAQECDALVPDGKGGTEKKNSFNGTFDAEEPLWDAVLRVCQIGRATPVWTGTNLTLAIDKPSGPVALFTVGNIGIDSFKAPFLPLANRASEIEIDFRNQDLDLERSTFSVYDPEIDGTEKVGMSLFGIIRPSEAWRAAKYRLNCNKYLKRSAEIEVDADALACTIGDVVNVAHDVPQWGYSGRIAAARAEDGNLKITLDREVEIAEGKTYEIQYRLNDDTLVTRTVLDGPGPRTEITVAGEEIVLNGGFETAGAGGADVFAGWEERDNGRGTIARDSAVKYGGAASLRMDDISGSLWTYQNLTLVPGGRYELTSQYLFSQVGDVGLISFRTVPDHYWLQADGTWSVWNPPPTPPEWTLPGGTGWRPIDIPFSVPHDAGTAFRIFLTNARVGSSIWFDDISLQRLPEPHAPYSFGESRLSVKPFRVVNLERSQDLRFRLALAEYNASVYASDTDQPVLPTPDYSALEIVGPVLSLACEERLVAGKSGIEAVIDVSFRKPTAFLFQHAEIWYSQNDGTFVYAGRSVDGNFRISPAEELATYRIKAVAVNNVGTRQSFGDAPEASLRVFGKTAPPEDIAEFWFEPSQGGVKLSWKPVSDADLDYYLIRWHPSAAAGTWGTALEVAKIYSTSLSLPAAQDGTYFIKAVDLSGNESAGAKTIVTTIPSILSWNAQERLEQEPFWSGAKTAMSENGGVLYLDSGTAFDGIADMDALPNWDYGVVAVPAVGYYEIGPVDLGSVQNCRCRGELSFYAVDREAGLDDIADIDALDNFNGADILGVGMLLQIALSQDGAGWGEWQNFLVGDYRARAFKFRLKAWSDFATRYVYADALRIGIDMPERVERGDGVPVAAGGTAITFAVPFLVRPQIGVAVESASSGDTIKLSAQSETGFTLQVLNGGAGVARTVDWRAVGY